MNRNESRTLAEILAYLPFDTKTLEQQIISYFVEKVRSADLRYTECDCAERILAAIREAK